MNLDFNAPQLPKCVTEVREIGWERGSRQTKARVYVWIDGEDIVQNLTNRFSRPHLVWREAIVVPVLRARGIGATSIRWSQRAGCSCGCSPGFIVNDRRLRTDLHIHARIASEVM